MGANSVVAHGGGPTAVLNASLAGETINLSTLADTSYGPAALDITNTITIDGSADEAAWDAVLGRLLESPTRRFDLAARGREQALAKYDWPLIARRHLDFFEELL